MALADLRWALDPVPEAPMVEERKARGLAARRRASRSSQAVWTPAPDRPDPLDLLQAQSRDRLQDLVPIRYGRMLVSPFAFLRGATVVMARDLATLPHSDLVVQLCGDAHVSNFGLFASTERRLYFGINDFDETAQGPFEWDVKRLSVSVAVVSRELGFSRRAREAALAAVGSAYQRAMASFAAMRAADLWYYRIDASDVLEVARRQAPRPASVEEAMRRARSRGHLQALARLTSVVEGRRVITPSPPLVVSATSEERAYARGAFAAYVEGLPHERRILLERYRFADVARKVVGVGSVGTRCWLVLLTGRDEQDPVFLQVKEATASAIEASFRPGEFTNHGQRIVVGQRLIQPSSDIFLGWIRAYENRDYYWRQLWDMKGDLDPLLMSPKGLSAYAGTCAWELARAHARTGDAIAITTYIGSSDRFIRAIEAFAEAYANQNSSDYAALVDAERTGRIEAVFDK